MKRSFVEESQSNKKLKINPKVKKRDYPQISLPVKKQKTFNKPYYPSDNEQGECSYIS